jgi:hypothetical protein
MTTQVQRSPEGTESRSRLQLKLIGLIVLAIGAVVVLLLLDRGGESRDVNRARQTGEASEVEPSMGPRGGPNNQSDSR